MESQIRELDSRLLLACCAAKAGRATYLGSTAAFNAGLWRLPRGIWFAKAMTKGSLRSFRRARRLGNTIVAWDEEAPVHYPADLYFPRRIDFRTLPYISRNFAWGQENLELWSGHPDFPMAAVTLSGNPRADLLKPEVRDVFEPAVRAIREQYGDFVLINTNFGSINCDLVTLNLKYPDPSRPGHYLYGATANGLPRDEVDTLFEHRRKIFSSFQDLIPRMAAALPSVTFVVRPHFAESIGFWSDLLKDWPNVRVVREGNVVPWLYAAKALIHNGCTTAVEAYALGVPAIAFEAVRGSRYDLELPNGLSHRCSEPSQVIAVLNQLAGSGLAARSIERDRLFQYHIFNPAQGLASDIIIGELDWVEPQSRYLIRLAARTAGWLGTKGNLRQSHALDAKQEHKRMKFPTVDLQEITPKLAAIGKLIGAPDLRVSDIGGGLIAVQVAHG